MKKTKWIYIVAAVLLALLLIALLLGDEAIISKLPSMLMGIAVGLMLVIAVIALAYLFSRRHQKKEDDFRAAAVAVQGVVTKVERVHMVKAQSSVYSVGGEMYILRAAYEYEGKRYAGAKRSYFGQPPYKVGDSIIVYVNPGNPAESKILQDTNPVQKSL